MVITHDLLAQGGNLFKYLSEHRENDERVHKLVEYLGSVAHLAEHATWVGLVAAIAEHTVVELHKEVSRFSQAKRFENLYRAYKDARDGDPTLRASDVLNDPERFPERLRGSLIQDLRGAEDDLDGLNKKLGAGWSSAEISHMVYEYLDDRYAWAKNEEGEPEPMMAEVRKSPWKIEVKTPEEEVVNKLREGPWKVREKLKKDGLSATLHPRCWKPEGRDTPTETRAGTYVLDSWHYGGKGTAGFTGATLTSSLPPAARPEGRAPPEWTSFAFGMTGEGGDYAGGHGPCAVSGQLTISGFPRSVAAGVEFDVTASVSGAGGWKNTNARPPTFAPAKFVLYREGESPRTSWRMSIPLDAGDTWQPPGFVASGNTGPSDVPYAEAHITVSPHYRPLKDGESPEDVRAEGIEFYPSEDPDLERAVRDLAGGSGTQDEPIDAEKILQSPAPWNNPQVQDAIDSFLSATAPAGAPGFRWTAWAQAVGPGVTAPYPPDHGSQSRYEFLWSHREEIRSASDGTLREWVERTLRGVKRGDAGNPWHNPAVRQAIDEWLRVSSPTSPQNGRWTEWGQAVGSGVTAIAPPDHGSMSRYEYLWNQRARLSSVAHGTLEEYLRTRGVGSPSDPGTSQQEPAQGVSRTTLQVGKRRPREGESISVPMWILRGEGLGSLNVEVRYDPAVVKVDGEVAQGNVVDLGMFEANGKEAGVVLVGVVSTKGLSGTGTLAVIPFRAVGAAGSRSALTLAVTAVSDTTGGTPTLDLMHGEVLVVGPEGVVPGDSNGDGALDERDARAALRMSVRKVPENLAVDMDKDGRVTAKDAFAILQKAARSR